MMLPALMILNEKVRNTLFILFVILLTVPAFSTLLRSGYFPMHDDMQAMRLLQMDKCVKDLQIPCRWVPDMGYGFGYPQFNFYAPLPYYAMEIFHVIGAGFLDSVKTLFVISIIASVLGMYLLGKDLWGTSGGLISALFYIYAPYRALNMYVRGAVGELAGMIVLPYIFLYINRLVNRRKNSMLWLSLLFAALFTSHNITIVYFVPLATVFFLLINFLQYRYFPAVFKNNLKKYFVSVLWGFLISSFFVLPALFEQKYVKIETLTYGYFNYVSHFVGFKQLLFNTFWGYGSSVAGPNDQAHLGIGVIHWLIPIVSLLVFIYLRKKITAFFILFFIMTGFAALFMVHPRSQFIWDRVSYLSFFQFPWRFLGLATFALSVAAGSTGLLISRNILRQIKIVLPIFLLLLLFYGSYFRPSGWFNLTDEQKFSGENWRLQQTVSINDYLPVFADKAPQSAALPQPEITLGDAEIVNGRKGTNWEKWKIRVPTDEAEIRLQTLYFPGWKIWVDSKESPVAIDNKLGLISVKLDKGDHEVYAKLTDTPVRKLGNLLTVIGIIFVPIYRIKQKRK